MVEEFGKNNKLKVDVAFMDLGRVCYVYMVDIVLIGIWRVLQCYEMSSKFINWY